MKASLLFLLFVIALGLASACQEKRDSENNPVLTAYRLIDEQRTDEAIETMEVELSKNPDNAEYKVVLASAYAHKSGIKIQKLVPVISQADRLSKLSQKIEAADKKKNLNKKVQSVAMDWSVLLRRFAAVLETYDTIPIMDEEQATYLRYAIYLLNDLGDKIKPEDVVYRMVLEVVLFKHLLESTLVGDVAAEAPTGDLGEKDALAHETPSCRIDVGHLNDSVITLGKLLIDIFNDIGFVNPSQSAQMKALGAQTSQTVSKFTLASTSVAVLDDASNLFLGKTLSQLGFVKALQCPGN